MTKWLAFFYIGLLRVLTYPVDIFGQFVSLATYLLIFLLVTNDAGNTALSDLQFWSLMSVFFMAIYFPSGGLFSFDIRTGRIFLIEVMPISHFLRLHGQYSGQRLIYILISFFVFCVIGLTLLDSYVELLLLPIFIVVSFTVALLFELLVSSVAFSVPYFFGLGELKSKITLIFSGILLVPDNLPWGLDRLAYFTPFPWLVYEPSLVILGQSEAIPVLVYSSLWLSALWIAFRFIALPNIHFRLNSFDG